MNLQDLSIVGNWADSSFEVSNPEAKVQYRRLSEARAVRLKAVCWLIWLYHPRQVWSLSLFLLGELIQNCGLEPGKVRTGGVLFLTSGSDSSYGAKFRAIPPSQFPPFHMESSCLIMIPPTYSTDNSGLIFERFAQNSISKKCQNSIWKRQNSIWKS